jgi:DNA-binding NtrC family response regulator
VSAKGAQAGAEPKPAIMVIEPEVLIRMTIAEFLRECGFNVIEGVVAEDVRTVLDSGVHLDIVFSEVRLPGNTDGFALARQLRNVRPEIDVILTSGLRERPRSQQTSARRGP